MPRPNGCTMPCPGDPSDCVYAWDYRCGETEEPEEPENTCVWCGESCDGDYCSEECRKQAEDTDV